MIQKGIKIRRIVLEQTSPVDLCFSTFIFSGETEHQRIAKRPWLAAELGIRVWVLRASTCLPAY